MTISDRRYIRPGWPRARVLLALALLVACPLPVVAATIKMATESPDGTVWMTLLREAGAAIEKETAGRVELKIYPGGVMGDDATVMRKMRIGQLQAAILTTGTFARIFPDVQLYNLPMQFANFEEVDYVRERLDATLRQGLEDNGFVCPGLAEVGMAYAMSRRPVRSISDASGIKLWTPVGNEAAVKAITAFGISPVPLAIADVLAGLQTGLIDAVAAPLVGALALQWHNQLDYILDLPFMYIYAVMVLPERAFGQLDDADQAIVRRLLGEAVRAADAGNRADHHAVREVLQQQGLEFIQPPAAEVRQWQARADAASLEWIEDGIVNAKYHDLLKSHLEAFRNAAGNPSGDARAPQPAPSASVSFVRGVPPGAPRLKAPARPRSSIMEQTPPVAGAPRKSLFHESAPQPAPSASPVARPRSSPMEQTPPVAGAPGRRLFHASAE